MNNMKDPFDIDDIKDNKNDNYTNTKTIYISTKVVSLLLFSKDTWPIITWGGLK